MDISLIKHEDNELLATIKLLLEPKDYEEEYDKELRKIRRQSNIPGFRPGQAPLSIVKKQAGQAVLQDVIEKKVGTAINDYLKDLNVVLNPIASDKYKTIADFKNPDKFEFYFDVLLRPQIDFDYENTEIDVPYYKVEVTDEDVEERIKLYTQQYGGWKEVDERETSKAVVYGVLEEISAPENSEPIKIENVPFIQSSFVDKEKATELEGLKKGESMNIDVKKDINEADLKYIFKDKNLNSDNFKFTVTSFKEFKEAEIGKELFEKLYGEEITEEEFKNRIREELENEGQRYAKELYRKELEDYLLEKIQFELPKEFLKHYLIERGNKQEDVEKYWDATVKSLKLDIVLDMFLKKMNIEITEEDIDNIYTEYAKGYLVQYGITQFEGNEEILQQVKESLYKDENLYTQIFATVAWGKVADKLIEMGKYKEQQISFIELEKLYNENIRGQKQ